MHNYFAIQGRTYAVPEASLNKQRNMQRTEIIVYGTAHYSLIKDTWLHSVTSIKFNPDYLSFFRARRFIL
jgi:hypothetical protein